MSNPIYDKLETGERPATLRARITRLEQQLKICMAAIEAMGSEIGMDEVTPVTQADATSFLP